MSNAKKEIEAKPTGMMLLPAKPGTCPECAVKHEAADPHNKDSLFYQYSFYGKNGRWPTWSDAIAHLDEAHQTAWKQALKEYGVTV